MTLLEEFECRENRLSGSIPDMSELSNLRVLSLRENQINGSISTSLGRVTALELLQIGVNQITGTIPSELGLLTALTDLNLRDNKVRTSEWLRLVASLEQILVTYGWFVSCFCR